MPEEGCRRRMPEEVPEEEAEREVEREGFEPPMDETAHTGFRDRRTRPKSPLK